MCRKLLKTELHRRASLVQGQVVPDPARCVQCGICSYNCPLNIDVRRHAWLGQAVTHSQCISCGECVARCPRGVLKMERTGLAAAGGQ